MLRTVPPFVTVHTFKGIFAQFMAMKAKQFLARAVGIGSNHTFFRDNRAWTEIVIH